MQNGILTSDKRTETKPDIPAFKHCSSVSTDRDFAPSVATILVSEGKNFQSSLKENLLDNILKKRL